MSWTTARNALATIGTALALTCAVVCQIACSAGTCQGDTDCPLQRVCETGACVTSCAFDTTRCISGEVCVGGHCQTACTSDDDCPTGSGCDSSGVCLTVYQEPDNDRPAGDDDTGSGDEMTGGDSATD